MSYDQVQKLLQGGIKAARSGQKDLARKAFTQILKLEPNHEAAWLGLATVTDEPKDRLRILKRILEINPDNAQAKEALRRLGIDAQPAASDTDLPAEIIADDSLDDIPLPPLPVGMDAANDIPLPPVIESSEAGMDTRSESQAGLSSLEAVFAQLPAAPTQGRDGLPLLPRDLVEHTAKQAMQTVQSYQQRLHTEQEQVTWRKKNRGRAGEGEYPIFLLQVASAILLTVFIIGSIITFITLQGVNARRAIAEATPIPTVTPPASSTLSPNATNTPSPSPSVQLSPSPQLDASITPGNPDPNFPPQATAIYFVDTENQGVETAIALFNYGADDEAVAVLEEERSVVASFEFTPTYYLVLYYLEQDDPETARQLVVDWLQENRSEEAGIEISSDDFMPYVDVAIARIDLYRVVRAMADGQDVEALFTTIENRLIDVINFTEDGTGDPEFADAYLMLAERYRLEARYDEAIAVLDDAIQTRGFYGNTEIRLKRAQVLSEQQQYAAALQEVQLILVLDPFLEPALVEQVEIALESDQAGLAVLYSEQYLRYYPASLHAYYLLGQAREAENKDDLAIHAYSRALLGPEDAPYYFEALRARMNLYLERGETELAESDLALIDDDAQVRILRMNAAFITGDMDTALEDAAILLESGEAEPAPLLLLQGRILIDRESYEAGLSAIEQALQRGLQPDDFSLANEYLARANLGLNNLDAALAAINLALDAGATGTRRYIRAQIYQEQGELEAALNEYEFVLTWARVYPYPFVEAAQARYEQVRRQLGQR